MNITVDIGLMVENLHHISIELEQHSNKYYEHHKHDSHNTNTDLNLNSNKHYWY